MTQGGELLLCSARTREWLGQECESTCRQKWTDLKFASKEDCICSGLVVVEVFGLEEWLLAIALIYLHEVDDDRSS